jgi:hypothetical protein
VAWFAIAQSVITPCLILAHLSRSNREDERFNVYWGHWVNNFSPDTYWFECFRLLRKTALVVVVNLINTVSLQAFVATIITVCSMFETILLRPYKIKRLDIVDGAGHLVIVICIQIGLAFCVREKAEDSNNDIGASVAIISLTVGWGLVILYLLKVTLPQSNKTDLAPSDSVPPNKNWPSLMTHADEDVSPPASSLFTKFSALFSPSSFNKQQGKHELELQDERGLELQESPLDVSMVGEENTEQFPECPEIT